MLRFIFVLSILGFFFFFTVGLIYGLQLPDSTVLLVLSAQQAAGLPFSAGCCLAFGDTSTEVGVPCLSKAFMLMGEQVRYE